LIIFVSCVPYDRYLTYLLFRVADPVHFRPDPDPAI